MINILPTAVLDGKQRRVISLIQPFTVPENVTLTVTRGHSYPLDQLRTIASYARKNDCVFSEFEHNNLFDTHSVWRSGTEYKVYLWQQTWSALLLKGVIVNPPLAAICLEHYIRPSGEDMYLKTLQPSPHILSDPIDFSALIDRGMSTERPDISLVRSILEKAKAENAGIRFIKPEPANMCVHIDLEKDA